MSGNHPFLVEALSGAREKSTLLREVVTERSKAPPPLDAEVLLLRAVKSAHKALPRKGQHQPRWVAVSELFVLGSTHSHQLCRWAGLNPDEMVKR